jgi:hypothetical protein
MVGEAAGVSPPFSKWFAFGSRYSIMPELAEFILNLNPDNRPIREMKVRQYASDMKDGRWQLNGEGDYHY